MQPNLLTETALRTPSVVLDTNVVLDAWVFNDPHLVPLNDALMAGEVRWLATSAMRLELERTLRKSILSRWQPDTVQVLALFDRTAQLVAEVTTPNSPALRCRDPSDQKFIDLALAHGCRWLVTHDKALLALARRARAVGLAVLPPTQWQLSAT